MEKYRLVQEHKAEGAELLEPFPVSTSSFPEVRITQQGKPRNYISHAMSLFVSAKYKKQLLRTTSTKVHGGYSSDRVSFMLGMYVCTHQCVLSFVFPPCSPTQGDGSSTVVLKAMGRAINKAVTICEILKRKMPLYQSNALSSVEMIDVYEPVEEGLDVVTSRRYVSCIVITLSLTQLDPTHSGYQMPLQEGGEFSGRVISSSG
jgi:DNA-binding protein